MTFIHIYLFPLFISLFICSFTDYYIHSLSFIFFHVIHFSSAFRCHMHSFSITFYARYPFVSRLSLPYAFFFIKILYTLTTFLPPLVAICILFHSRFIHVIHFFIRFSLPLIITFSPFAPLSCFLRLVPDNRPREPSQHDRR